MRLKFSRGFAPLIIFLVLAVVTVGGFVIYQKYYAPNCVDQSKGHNPVTLERCNSTPTPVPNQTPNGDIANWKNYFTIKYPESWEKVESAYDGNSVAILGLQKIIAGTVNNNNEFNDIYITIYSEPGISFEEIKRDTINVENTQNIIIDGVKSVKYIGSAIINGEHGAENTSVRREVIVSSLGDKQFIFKIDVSNGDFTETDQILSTFRFTK